MNLSNYGHWDISQVGPFDPLHYYGFIYLVTNTKTGRMYIGKKSMWSTRTKQVWKVDHSEKKNTKVTKESEWRSYTTSSSAINAEILVGEVFTFQILSLHTSKGTLAYNEVEQMVMRDVLRLKFANGDRVYYNGCIPGIKFLPPDEHSETSRLKMSISAKKRAPGGGNTGKKGKPAWNNGKKMTTPSPKKGKPTGIIAPSCFKKGHIPVNKGITPSDETKEKISNTLKGRKPIWTGTKQSIITCPHCGKEGANNAMKHWHFDNCKHKELK